MKNTKQLSELSEVLSNLAYTISTVTSLENKTEGDKLNTVLLIATFNHTLSTLSKEITIDSKTKDQLELGFEPKVEETTNVKKEEAQKDNKHKVIERVHPETEKIINKTELKVEEKVVTEPIVVANETTVSAADAFKKCFEYLENLLIVNSSISKEHEEAAKEEIKKEYSKVQPSHLISKNKEELDTFYAAVLLPAVKQKLEEEAITTILTNTVSETVETQEEVIEEGVVEEQETTEETTEETVEVAEETYEDATVDAETDLNQEPEETVEEDTETQVLDLINAIDNGVSVEKETAITAPIVGPEELVVEKKENIVVPSGEFVIQPKEFAKTLVSLSNIEEVKNVFKGIFTSHFNKKDKTEIKGIGIDFYDYTYNTLRELKALTGGHENSTLIKMGNKPLGREIKVWKNTWSKSA